MRRYLDTYRLALELLELTQQKLATVRRSVSLDELWTSMSFCVLSSNVRLDSANKAHHAICAAPNLFDIRYRTDDLEYQIQNRLCRAGYRFHRTRAVQLAKSWFALRNNHAQLVDLFDNSTDIMSVREYVIKTFPGLGIKQATMFLRDIGVTRELAIIDIHLKRFLSAHVAEFNPSIKRDYLRAETWLGDLARLHTSSVAAVDLAIWAAARTLQRSKTC
jgi:N-glycosylase/DNA lyase